MGAAVPVPTRAGLHRTDIHGGTVYITDPISWHIGVDSRVPYHNYNGNGSQSVANVPMAMASRTRAAEYGAFAVRGNAGANYDAVSPAGDPSLPVEQFGVGHFVVGHPLDTPQTLGRRHLASVAPVRNGIEGRGRPGW